MVCARNIVLKIIFICLCSGIVKAQDCSSLNINLEAEIPSVCGAITMTMIHDQEDRPFLYVANKSAGLVIYDISVIENPIEVNAIQVAQFDSLDVMNLTQDGSFLYLALGNHFTNPQPGGIAIVNVSDPINPFVADVYVLPFSNSGAGIVKVHGNHAFLGAMKSGVCVFDISNKDSIDFISQFVPDINYPVDDPNADLYNARGMDIKNDRMYLCYDAGGLRVIDISDKNNIVEIGHYANPALFVPINLPRAYNNIVINDSLAYVTVDYCGLEILNISDPSDISLTGWWNPYDCPGNNWFSSPSHTNEIFFHKACDLVFLSTGKSDMIVVDVSDPALPDSCNYYGGVENMTGTWGVSSYDNHIFLSYICAFIPFPSIWTGIKILSYTSCSTGLDDLKQSEEVVIYPNPAYSIIHVDIRSKADQYNVFLYDLKGIKVRSWNSQRENKFTFSTEGLSSGLYFLNIRSEASFVSKQIFIYTVE